MKESLPRDPEASAGLWNPHFSVGECDTMGQEMPMGGWWPMLDMEKPWSPASASHGLIQPGLEKDISTTTRYAHKLTTTPMIINSTGAWEWSLPVT